MIPAATDIVSFVAGKADSKLMRISTLAKTRRFWGQLSFKPRCGLPVKMVTAVYFE
jgi:hypothetical protein